MREIMQNICQITFISFQEAYDKRDYIKEKYANLDVESKEIYKWYYYHQLCLMTSKKMGLKDYLWLYIVGKDNVNDKLQEEYNKFNKKVCKIKEKNAKTEAHENNLTIFDILGI